ncbi:MAG: hypothetical protein B6U95_05830 [Thermofilum sp. ex4484_82]|nr:MAG: hypothetical protein B6U95_05830 [Thermofilum sp. ex4484_82]OYT37815.1 MAG: hypothetical protein B6U96_05820 [Archaeoglobales archaeon ex4484_92]
MNLRRIAVGVSGGKDSVALLYILSKIERRFPRSELIAITIDEGIKGYREESLRIARKVAKDLDVEHVVFSFKDKFFKRRYRETSQTRTRSINRASKVRSQSKTFNGSPGKRSFSLRIS